MTIVHTFDIRCDRCGTWEHGWTGTDANPELTKPGWTRLGSGYDLCPLCTENTEKIMEIAKAVVMEHKDFFRRLAKE